MGISIYNDFSEYMVSKGIKSVKNIDVKYKNINLDTCEKLINEQFKAIYTFHEKSLGFNSYLRNRLNNNTGKVIEEYKIYIKKLTRDLNNFKKNKPKNNFEELIVQYGEAAITRGEECLKVVYDSDYIDIITRSMKRTEICLGNTSFENLKKSSSIEVISFEDCCYNMIEMDCFFLLSKLKRKEIDVNFNKLVNKFCYIEGLEINSARFIIALLSYPCEFMKCCNRYREDKKQWSEEQSIKKLLKALKQDGDSLI